MNKGKFISLTVIILLVAIFTFSCSSNNSPELVAQSSGSEKATQSSSSEETAQSSSSEWTVQSSSSEWAVQSSSSEESTQSSSSKETAQSSSSEETAQSSSSEGTAQSSSSEETALSSSSEWTAQSSSSEWTAQSSSSEYMAQSSSSSNSSSSSGNTTFGTAGFWFLTTDEANDGTSTVGNTKNGDGNYIVLVQDGGNSVAKIQNYSLGRALYDAKMNQYPAYVDMSLSLKNNNEYKEILSCEGGFIYYKYKGAAHRFRTKLSTVTDNNYHYATVSASEDWKTAIIPISDLKQESSGASRPFDFGRLDSLSWYLRDGLSSKTGDLAVYNVKCTANCDGKTYDPAMQFCNGNNILDKCGGNEYDPATQFCENGSVKNELKDSRDGKAYKFVRIGGQTWMAENLNYNASGSRCYSNLESNCDTYGRLYDWSTAMNFASSCNSSSCSSQIQTKHRGVCPSGWHIPSDSEWDVLMTAVGGSSSAGTKLKAANGWNNNFNGVSGPGTDQYGFSALPGGAGAPSGDGDVGSGGYWWSATERYDAANYAYMRRMGYNISNVDRNTYYKYSLFSVRCVQD
jgi:uncharacterized protein (TIGR02145 family)